MARKQAVFLSCDDPQCSYVVEIAPDDPEVPEGWHRLTAEADGEWAKTHWEFHSLRCVERFAKARRHAVAGKPLVSSGGGNAEQRQEAASKAIREVVEAMDQPLTANEIGQLAGLAASTVNKYLAIMQGDGLVIEVEPRRGPHGAKYVRTGQAAA